MLNNRRVWVPLAIVICLLSITAVWLISTAQGAAPTGVVGNYITALQHKDFRKIIDLTSTYKMEIARIKSQNPQALWPKLLEDYYKDKTTVLSSDPGFWVNYSGSAARETPLKIFERCLVSFPQHLQAGESPNRAIKS